MSQSVSAKVSIVAGSATGGFRTGNRIEDRGRLEFLAAPFPATRCSVDDPLHELKRYPIDGEPHWIFPFLQPPLNNDTAACFLTRQLSYEVIFH